jgi:hydrogenase maturation protein HypF
VATVRARKRRDGKPLAVMVAGLGAARRLARLDAAHEAALLSPERPIVIAPLAQGARLAQGVTQGLPTIGLFLPTTPAQALIFHDLAGQPEGTAWMAEDDHALVMTSANLSGEPIVIDDDEARARLPALADLIVAHDREILVRADDSVVTIIAGAPALIRRARGHAPERVRMPRALPPALGVGAHLKATACLIEGDGAVLTAHLGDLDTPSAIAGHADAVAHLTGLIRAAPRVIGHDLHPDLAATRYAARRGEGDGLPLVGVQHHHAHAAAVAAEHGVLEGYLGLVLDGVGYGPGGAIWGGELLAVDGAGMRRLGHLAPIALPGGDIAAREPWRVAAGLLHAMGRGDAIAARFAGQKQAALLAQNLPSMAAPMTSSAGRLFDAAAALLGVAEVNRFEGEAAMRLEALVARPRLLEGGSVLHGGMLDVGPLMHALADEREARRGAELFHGTLIAGLTALTLQTAEAENRDVVALGGGCFLNRWLSEGLMDSLTAAGLRPLLPRALPCNDGAIAFGQAVVAALALERAESPRPGRR